ncbi:UPF0149 family protein [Telmatospirillum sp.]|uniref:UPF0149 family protein n=1 Tax=Telmatospirillum sp. TaxID=2079197 RepID=UPI00284D47FC|nr:UPF0149 family protein [Telmatospirillum sp.]MDR3436320.1 UPF0149 family protein [Telmatospirillum sp.]
MKRSKPPFTYDELDEILRGKGGPDGFVGISAIDGLIAALVAAPTFVHPSEWLPLIFGGRLPMGLADSPEDRAIQTVFNRYNEVSATLSERPAEYRPMFMVDDDGSLFVRHWAVGFMMGVGLRRDLWSEIIFLTKHRSLMEPILLYFDVAQDFLFDMPAAEKARRKPTAYQEISQAVVAIRTVCNPYRAAEAAKPTRSKVRTRRPR